MPELINNRMNFKHATLVFAFSFIVIFPAFSQMESQLSQYMFSQATFNPASIGENGMINASINQKIQWLGILGAPVTTHVCANAPFKFGNSTHAFGATFLRDQAGAFLNQSANLQYAFKKKVGEGILSLGTGIGFVGMSIISDSLVDKRNLLHSDYHVQDDNVQDDNAVPKKDENGLGLNIDAGIFYTAKKYYGGVSFVHLNNPSFRVGDSLKFKMSGSLFLTGGFDVNFDDPKYVLKSSTLFKSDFISWQLDLSSRLEYDKKYWGGLSYRFQDAVVVFAGLNLSNGLSIGYSYDLPTSALITTTSGSHEICLSYSFMLDTGKNKNKYKSIRIL